MAGDHVRDSGFSQSQTLSGSRAKHAPILTKGPTLSNCEVPNESGQSHTLTKRSVPFWASWSVQDDNLSVAARCRAGSTRVVSVLASVVVVSCRPSCYRSKTYFRTVSQIGSFADLSIRGPLLIKHSSSQSCLP